MIEILTKFFLNKEREDYIKLLNSLILSKERSAFEEQISSDEFKKHNIFGGFLQNGSQDLIPNAASVGNLSAIDLLASNGGNVNSTHKLGFTALTISCKNKDIEVITKLLSWHADPNHSDTRKFYPLNIVCINGFFEAAALLIDHGAIISNQMPVKVSSYVLELNAIECAVYSGNIKLVKYLWEDIIDSDTRKFLLTKSDNVLNIAILSENKELIDYFSSQKKFTGNDNSEFVDAVHTQNNYAIKILLKYGANINQYITSSAIPRKSVNLIYQMLLTNNSQRYEDGFFNKQIKYLLRLGANINFSFRGETGFEHYPFDILDCAVNSGNVSSVRILLENNAVIREFLLDKIYYSRIKNGEEIKDLILVAKLVDRLANSNLQDTDLTILENNKDFVVKRIISKLREYNSSDLKLYLKNIGNDRSIGESNIIFKMICYKLYKILEIFKKIDSLIKKSENSTDHTSHDDIMTDNVESFYKKRLLLEEYLSKDKLYVVLSNLDYQSQLDLINLIRKLLSEKYIDCLSKKLRFNLIIHVEDIIDESQDYVISQLASSVESHKSGEMAESPDFKATKLLDFCVKEEYAVEPRAEDTSLSRSDSSSCSSDSELLGDQLFISFS